MIDTADTAADTAYTDTTAETDATNVPTFDELHALHPTLSKVSREQVLGAMLAATLENSSHIRQLAIKYQKAYTGIDDIMVEVIDRIDFLLLTVIRELGLDESKFRQDYAKFVRERDYAKFVRERDSRDFRRTDEDSDADTPGSPGSPDA